MLSLYYRWGLGVNDFKATIINMKIIESLLKYDKNESSWTFNQRLVSAKQILTVTILILRFNFCQWILAKY